MRQFDAIIKIQGIIEEWYGPNGTSDSDTLNRIQALIEQAQPVETKVINPGRIEHGDTVILTGKDWELPIFGLLGEEVVVRRHEREDDPVFTDPKTGNPYAIYKNGDADFSATVVKRAER